MAAVSLTAARLRELLSYDSKSGEFRWIRSKKGVQIGMRTGAAAGNRYIYITIEHKRHLAHRLAWLYVYGQWPKHQVDHIDRDRRNNRIANLRDVPSYQNNQNIEHARSFSKSGVLGVSWHDHSRKWRARIMRMGVETRLGLFDTLEQASAAYVRAKRQIHEACAI